MFAIVSCRIVLLAFYIIPERERERVSSTVIAISFLLGRVCIVQIILDIIVLYQFDISIRAVRRQSSIIIINVNIPNPQI